MFIICINIRVGRRLKHLLCTIQKFDIELIQVPVFNSSPLLYVCGGLARHLNFLHQIKFTYEIPSDSTVLYPRTLSLSKA